MRSERSSPDAQVTVRAGLRRRGPRSLRHRRGGGGRRRGGCRDRRRRRPRGPVRPRHGGRGQRRREPRAAGRAARAGRGGRGDGDPRRDGPPHRPAVRDRTGRWMPRPRPVRCCRRSSPAKRARRRSRRSSSGDDRPERAPAGLAPPLRRIAAVLLPASDPGRPERDHEREQRTGPPLRLRALVHVVLAHATSASRADARTDDAFTRVGPRAQRRAPARAPTSCSCTRATSTRPSRAPSLSCWATHASALDAGQEAVVEFDVPAARLAFTSRGGERIVEPGAIRAVGRSLVRRCARRPARSSSPAPFTS